MTEDEWLSDTTFQSAETWNFITANSSARKRRLFGVACCRRILRLIPLHGRHVLESIEEAIDARPSDEDIGWGRSPIPNDVMAATIWDRLRLVQSKMSEIRQLTDDIATKAACHAVASAAALYGFDETPMWAAGHAAEASGVDRAKTEGRNLQPQNTMDPQEVRAQMNLVREIIGNPFRPVSVAPSLLQSHDNTIPKFAQSIYDTRAFSLLPILADALEDAGCDHADILSHCRQPGEHVRGCWVVDLLLGKS